MEEEELKQALKNYIEWHAIRDSDTDEVLLPIMQRRRVRLAMNTLYEFELQEE